MTATRAAVCDVSRFDVETPKRPYDADRRLCDEAPPVHVVPEQSPAIVFERRR
jgi:hypothetical protein